MICLYAFVDVSQSTEHRFLLLHLVRAITFPSTLLARPMKAMQGVANRCLVKKVLQDLVARKRLDLTL